MRSNRNNYCYALIFAILIGAASSHRATSLNYRLPNDTVPLRYDLTLETDLERFNGSVVIDILIVEPTDTITLHAQHLDVIEVIVTDSDDVEIPIASIATDEPLNFLVVRLARQLTKDDVYHLNFRQFRGQLATDNDGFYLALYNENGIEKRMATTQFESTGARKAYPCYDEPGIKATFCITLIHPEDYTSISNEVLLTSESIGDGRVKDTYRETVKMSTYLTAFVVSQYDHVSAGRHRVFGRPQHIRDGLLDYALRTGRDVLQAFERYLGVNYTLAKIDQIGIPDEYFAPGAMENWGLVTFRESYLLIDADSTTAEVESTTTVIAHEFGHQWFGNLVTLKWWRYLWLNEGFANFMEYLGTDKVRPEWKILDRMVVNDVQYALALDSRADTQPLNYEGRPGQGATTYVSYQKGGSVLRMVQHVLTDDTFRRGLHRYLNKFQFQAVEPDDLFDSWQEAMIASRLPPGATVNSILTPWIVQPGYPVVDVFRRDGKIILKQERLVSSNSSRQSSDATWPIPINFATNGSSFAETTPTTWLTAREQILPDAHGPDEWLIANKQQTGYYRVNYDRANWQRLIEFLLTDDISAIDHLNRAQLIDDSYKLARIGRIAHDVPLNLSRYIGRETDRVPLLAYSNNAMEVALLLSDTDVHEAFRKFVTEQFRGESNVYEASARYEIVKLLCHFGGAECERNAWHSYREWIANDRIEPDLQVPYLCVVVRSDRSSHAFDYIYERLRTRRDERNVRKRLTKALSCAQNVRRLDRLFANVLNDNGLSDNEKIDFILDVHDNGNKDYVMEYLAKRSHVAKAGVVGSERLLMEMSRRCTTELQYLQLRGIILKRYPNKSSVNALIEEAQTNVMTAERSKIAIRTWLLENFPI